MKNRLNISPYNALKAFVASDQALRAGMQARDICFVLLIMAETPAKFEEFCMKCGVARHPSFGKVLEDLQSSIVSGAAKAAPAYTESAKLDAAYRFSQGAREKLDDIMVENLKTYFIDCERKRLHADMQDIDDRLAYNRQCRSADLDQMGYRMSAERQQIDYDVKIKQEQVETHVIHKELAKQQLEHNNIQHQATMDPLNHLFCHNIPVPAPTEQSGDAVGTDDIAMSMDNTTFYNPGCDTMDEEAGDAVVDQDAGSASTPAQDQDVDTSLTDPVVTETVSTSQLVPQDTISQEDMDTVMGDEVADDATTETDIAYAQRLKAQQDIEQRNYEHAMEDPSSDFDDNSSKDSEYQVSEIDKDEDMEEEPESTAPRRSLRKKASAIDFNVISDNEVVG